MKQHTEHDPLTVIPRQTNAAFDDRQLAELLKGSFPERSADETERLTRQIMRRLPERRRKSAIALLLAYIQSPFWLVTAIILILILFALNLGDLLERIDNPQSIFVTVVVISCGAALLSTDMLRDVEKMKA